MLQVSERSLVTSPSARITAFTLIFYLKLDLYATYPQVLLHICFNYVTLCQFWHLLSLEVRSMIEDALLKQLLEAGAHFGHHTSYWHPKVKRYIFTQRNSIHIIDLEQTVTMLEKACTFVRDLVAQGQSILFVGTKKQAQQAVEEEAMRCGMSYINQRWLGGMLTNFATIQTRIDYLVRLEEKREKGEFGCLSKKERLRLEKKILRLNTQMGSFKEVTTLPGALFIVDPIKDKIALAEAKKLSIPVIAIVDTNCNPDSIDYPIPANDDAVKAIKLICSKIAEAVIEGKNILEAAELAAEKEPEETVEILGSYTFEPGEDENVSSHPER